MFLFQKSKLVKSLILAAAFAISASLAHATPITAGLYQATGITVSGTTDTLTGTLTFNSAGQVTASTLTFNSTGNPVFSVISSNNTCCSPVEDEAILTTPTNAGQLQLYYLPTLNSSGDIVICLSGSTCQNDANIHIYSPNLGPDTLTAGTLNPVVAPEPSSLVLLGSGILGLAGAARRRILRV